MERVILWRIGEAERGPDEDLLVRYDAPMSLRGVRGGLTRCSTVVAAVGVVVAMSVVTTVAGAAQPVFPQNFQGPSTHHLFSVSVYTLSATTLQVEVTTPHRTHSTCPHGIYDFSTAAVRVSASGSFAVTDTFPVGSPELQFRVTGDFTSPRRVRGVIAGNDGCGTDTYVITLPTAPTLVRPCTLLTESGAATLFGGRTPTSKETYYPGAGVGDCSEMAASGVPALRLDVESSLAALYVHLLAPTTALRGLGAGATIDVVEYGEGNDEIQILFHRTIAWVYLSYSFHDAGNSTSGLTAVEGRLLVVSRKVYSKVA